MSRFKKASVLIILLVFPTLFYVILSKGTHKLLDLPYYGPKTLETTSNKKPDTLYYRVPGFSFFDTDSASQDFDNYDSTIVVLNFYNLEKGRLSEITNNEITIIQNKFKDKDFIKVLSLNSVRLEDDLFEAFQKTQLTEREFWQYGFQSKEAINEFAQNGLLCSQSQLDSLVSTLVLIDTNHNIRGYYSCVNKDDVKRVIDDISILIATGYVPRKKKK